MIHQRRDLVFCSLILCDRSMESKRCLMDTQLLEVTWRLSVGGFSLQLCNKGGTTTRPPLRA